MKSDVFHVKPMWLFCTEKIEHFVCYIKSGYGSEIPIIDQLVQSSLETCGYDDISLQGSSIVSLHVEGNVRFQFKTISSMKPRSHPWISNRRDLDCTHTHLLHRNCNQDPWNHQQTVKFPVNCFQYQWIFPWHIIKMLAPSLEAENGKWLIMCRIHNHLKPFNLGVLEDFWASAKSEALITGNGNLRKKNQGTTNHWELVISPVKSLKSLRFHRNS